jgi:acidic leucine-rich nuclear phosphoprotein 32 family protein A/C/D
LGGNPIQDTQDLEPLKDLSTLVQLDLFGCPISEKADYRDKVFTIFSGLEILDNQDKEGNDVDYDEEEEGDEEGDDEEVSEGEEEDDEEDDEDDEDSEDEKPKKRTKRN